MSIPSPSYQLTFLNPSTGRVIKILDPQSWDELRYSRVYNGVGAMAITMPLDVVDTAMFDLVDMFMVVQRTSPVTGALIEEETYLARRFQRYQQGERERYTIGGVSLNHLIGRRLIDPADDPLVAGGYSTKAGAADAVLYEYCSQQMAGAGTTTSRAFPGLSVAGVLGTFPAIGLRLRYDNLLQICQDNAKPINLDFQIVRTGGVLMQMNIGQLTVNRTKTANFPTTPFVLLTPQRGNLSNPSFTVDHTDEQNYVYMQGKGQGSNRIVLQQSDGASVSASPFNRIEFSADSRNTEKGDSTGLITDAAAILKERQKLTRFDFEPLGTEPGNIYRLDWDVGDRVTAQWETQVADVRITAVEISVSESGERLSVATEVLV